ncbi:hypothetical protein [Prauserella marina]|uniref:hypothetical protein n=1 Tax=Prauserella marina TaxID=530584 RepID=UPI001FEC3432|nr:hypothetical protein [Prauserella marina]
MPTTSPRSHWRWLVPVLIVVVSLTVGGGLLAREFYQAPSVVETSEPGAGPSPTSLAPAEQPGSGEVELAADAAAHPRAGAVKALLQAHFDAINARDYDAWASTVVAERMQAQPRQEWLTNYRSTRDGSIVVYRIELAPEQRLSVLVGFTSTQELADAPADLPEECVRWQLTFPMVMEGSRWKIDTAPSGSLPEKSAC